MAEINPIDNNIQEEEQDEDQLEEEQKRLSSEFYEKQAIEAAGSGNLEEIKQAYQKKKDSITYVEPKKKWTPLVWAANKNHIEILKFLVEKGALQPYLEINEEIFPQKCTSGVINSNIRPTPLQWACFQGNLEIVWILLKNGCRWSDVDQFGNTSVHLAACGGNVKVFESLLMFGVSCESKNSRNHTVKDLATNKEILKLIDIHQSAKRCFASNELLEGKTKYWCQNCRNIFIFEEFEIKWTWADAEASQEEQYRIDGRCKSCWNKIAKYEDEIEKLMKKYQYGPLNEKIEEIEANNIQIDQKKFKAAQELQEQLRTQNVILDYIDSLKVIENYKSIFKSVHYLRERKQDAVDRGVTIDDNVRDKTDREIERLLAERKLRFDLDNFQIGNCTVEDRDELSQSIEDAKVKGVAANYLEESQDMQRKMDISIEAKDIFKMFKEYQTLPENEYPKCFYLDRKTQKIFDPETKKPADSKSWPPPKQKKKKKKKGQNQLVIPDWCAEGPEQLEQKIKTLKELLESAEECKFDEDFINKCNEELKRMTIEWKFRVAKTEENRLVAEYWLAQKKKKK